MTLEEYLQNHPKKYLIFDLDETIIKIDMDWGDYSKKQYEIMKDVDKKSADKIIDLWTKNSHKWRDVMNSFIKNHKEKIRELTNFNCDYEISHYRGKDKLNNDLIFFIKNNWQKYNFYLYSSNSKALVDLLLTKYSLGKFFKKIITRDDVGLTKPDTEGFYKLYQKGTDLRKYLMIGDSYPDAGVAKNAGIDFFEVKMS